MNPEEHRVINTLALAWNQFLDLPEMHPQDKIEFMNFIHGCQNIVLAREALRHLPGRTGSPGRKVGA